MVSCPYPQYLCGQFSRFGVGSKNAAFFLGDNVSVESKSKNSKSIHSVSFQRVRTLFYYYPSFNINAQFSRS